MENVNPSSLSLWNEFSHLEKKIEIKLWLENNGSVDSLVSSDNEFEEEIEEEEKEEDDLEYFDTFLTIEELWQAYIDLESPINVMSKLNYYWIMSQGLELRKKPSNLNKNCNFIGRVRGLKVFIGNFTYECDFVMLEDTTSIIDHYLRGMVLGKPFVKEYGLVYDRDE
ncbi:hypothetical protein Tco_1462560 [Tanacetum coccineum]